MKYLIEETKNGQKIYETMLIENPKALSVFSNDLSLKIIKELSSSPACAMDIARRLKQHEQKIYYHMRKLEKVGIIKLENTEERVGAVAKIYSLASPTISFKIFDTDFIKNVKTKPAEAAFLNPFIENGKLNAIIIIGSPDPHGKYKSSASDGYCVINLSAYIGQFISDIKLPFYKLDTQIDENDLKNNLIIIGGPKANMISEKINKKLPIYFDYSEELLDWRIISTLSKNIYREKEIGVIIRMSNPFNEKKEILFLSGKGFRGSLSAIIGFTKYLKEVQKGNVNDNRIIAKIVKGIDTDSDGIIDDVEFIE